MSEEYERLLEAFTQNLFDGSDPMPVARQKLEAVHGHPVADDVEVDWVELGGVRCAWVGTPESRGSDRVLFFCHGGAYIAACGDGYVFYAAMLSRVTRARVLLVDYRLAPEHLHPAALEDCVEAYKGLVAAGTAASRVAFIGDSCGGGFVITSLLALRAQDIAMPAAGVTLGGWFDLEASADSAVNPAGRDPFASAAFTRARGRDYVGPDADLRDPLVSPIHAELTGLPPLLLQVGQIDLTRDDAIRLASNAGRDGVDVSLEIHPGMVHGFQGLANAGIPEAVEALERVSRWLDLRWN